MGGSEFSVELHKNIFLFEESLYYSLCIYIVPDIYKILLAFIHQDSQYLGDRKPD
jgi:hypothetical protein